MEIILGSFIFTVSVLDISQALDKLIELLNCEGVGGCFGPWEEGGGIANLSSMLIPFIFS